MVFALAISLGFSLPQYQKDSLIGFYNATLGEGWAPQQWDLSSDPCGTPTWFGVACDSLQDNVLSIILQSNNLFGTLPDLLLPGLETL